MKYDCALEPFSKIWSHFMYFYIHFKCILCPNEISELYKIFCIECLGIALAGIQVWCKQFEGKRRCDNFHLLT